MKDHCLEINNSKYEKRSPANYSKQSKYSIFIENRTTNGKIEWEAMVKVDNMTRNNALVCVLIQ